MAADPPAAASAPEGDPPGTGAQRWLARLSFVLAAAAAAIVPSFAGLKSLAMLAAGLAAVVVSLARGSPCHGERAPRRDATSPAAGPGRGLAAFRGSPS